MLYHNQNDLYLLLPLVSLLHLHLSLALYTLMHFNCFICIFLFHLSIFQWFLFLLPALLDISISLCCSFAAAFLFLSYEDIASSTFISTSSDLFPQFAAPTLRHLTNAPDAYADSHLYTEYLDLTL